MWVAGTVIGDILAFLITFSIIVITYFKWSYKYWYRKNLPYLEPQIPFGNMGTIFDTKEHPGIILHRHYNTIRHKGWKNGGMYGILTPFYLVTDLDYIKNILTKDFHHFCDRGIYHNERSDPLTAHLFNIGGTKWKNIRTKLTPTFTSGKIKIMFQTLIECLENLQKRVQKESDQKAPIDIKQILSCFTTEIIGSCAFGLNLDTFKNPNSPFLIYGRRIFERPLEERVRRHLGNTFPNLSRILNLSILPKDLANFFMKTIKDTIHYREENNINRKDFLQLLIDLKNDRFEDEGYRSDGTTLTLDQIASNCFAFFAAGYETSSSTMTFALFELAKNQDLQDKVRNEINSVLMIYEEALRMYPPLPILSRKCVKDYRIPGTGTVIEKDITVLISVLGIHYDEEIYPDPEKFDPERFNEKNNSSRYAYAHLPFGAGPKNCIGMRFGMVQSKVGLASLLKTFRFTVNKKTREPFEMKSHSLVLSVEGEIWLDAERV